MEIDNILKTIIEFSNSDVKNVLIINGAKTNKNIAITTDIVILILAYNPCFSPFRARKGKNTLDITESNCSAILTNFLPASRIPFATSPPTKPNNIEENAL